MDYTMIQVGLWLTAGVFLLLLLSRRRKRKAPR
jgi:hypothetical protein